MKPRIWSNPNWMRILFSFLLAIMISTPALAGNISPDLEEALNSARPGEEIPVIVTLADSVDLKGFKKGAKGPRRAEIIKALRNKADTTQGPLLAALTNKKVKKLKKFWIFNGASFQAPADVIDQIADFPGIASIRLDATLSAPEPSPAAAAAPEWNISAVRAPELWALGYTGGGIVVANMDTGVDPDHQDISAKWRGGGNSWFDPHGQYDSPHDSNGHGTQTMGIMVGGDIGGTAIGMAPDAQWIAVKIYDNTDETTYSAIHQGFQWLLDPDGNPNTNDIPDVVNNSWGFELNAGECITEFVPDIAALKAMDIAVVFSGGNRGPYPNTSVSPANNSGTFAVGAVDDSQTVTYFSSRGPSACGGDTYPELVAPGANIRTADLTFSGAYPDSYVYVNGTSFAVPHVAGAMGLLMSADPSLGIDQIEAALAESALDLGEPGPDNVSGSGLLDVMAAYSLLVQNQPQCTDSDGDDFYAELDCGTPMDCNDTDAGTYPGACDIKSDGIDQDCNGTDRTKGKPCPDTGGTEPPPPDDTGGVEGKGKTCSDGLDNDNDGAVDCGDSDCSKNKSCK